MNWTVEDSKELYQVESWGQGLFNINEDGNICVCPDGDGNLKESIDIHSIIKEMESQGIALPAVIRFHDILHVRVRELNLCFKEKIKESGFRGNYQGVYPIKVNPLREVVDEIVQAGEDFHYGLEAGSRPELMAVLASNPNPKALTILNGHKDDEYLQLALLGTKIGRNLYIVIEKFSELERLIPMAQKFGVRPNIGIRIRMSKIGNGKWCDSTGPGAKFGLSSLEVLQALEYLKKHEFLDQLQLLHFHLGSQVSEIRTLKEAITEAGRIFCNLFKLGAPLKYLDVGGGLGVDYQGKKSTDLFSMNYDLQEYVSDIVYGLQQICDLENVPHPTIVSESGRSISAHHSCVITNVIDQIKGKTISQAGSLLNCSLINLDPKNEHIIVSNIREVLDDVKIGKLQESFNDCMQLKDEAESAFKLGVLSFQEKAIVEGHILEIFEKIKNLCQGLENPPKCLKEIENLSYSQFLCNFSVFHSAIDCWAIDQLLPVVPINKHQTMPTEQSVVVDITCDSDGKIRRYVGPEKIDDKILLHKFDREKREDYYIGLFLTGAYEDVMGDNHNLFARTNEVHVYFDPNEAGNYYIEEYIKATTVKKVLSEVQYDSKELAKNIKKEIDFLIKNGKILAREGVALVDFYESALKNQTYLNKEQNLI